MTRTPRTPRTLRDAAQHRAEQGRPARARVRSLARRLDQHSLWAFNPPAELAHRSRRPSTDARR